jgi:hypothetical protein
VGVGIGPGRTLATIGIRGRCVAGRLSGVGALGKKSSRVYGQHLAIRKERHIIWPRALACLFLLPVPRLPPLGLLSGPLGGAVA